MADSMFNISSIYQSYISVIDVQAQKSLINQTLTTSISFFSEGREMVSLSITDTVFPSKGLE